ncbi:MAG TPA: HNH endonuclease [Pyrinomonadaceae bacterium]|nr:HNH endonuclease [Pyrinomonadaceae bacterium]
MNPRYPAVAERAGYRCEYCHAPQAAFNFRFEVEHILPRAEGGTDEEDNLALACRSCNIYKSAHSTGFDEITRAEVRLFNPRVDAWEEHFELFTAGLIWSRTDVGRATVMRLRLNSRAQLNARPQWMRLGLFP